MPTLVHIEVEKSQIGQKFTPEVGLVGDAAECLDNLIQKNNEFYDGNRYQVGLDHGDIDTYYKCDQIKIQDNFIIPLRNCNFIQW